jgi:ABC-type sugar transport system ATPase subunit
MIEVRNLTIRSGNFVLPDISFTIADGQYAVLMGRTGCGKTSILEAISGLRKVSGTIVIDGIDVTKWAPGDRGVGYVPQDLALFPTLTVQEHLQFALRLRKWSREAIAKRSQELACVLGIEHLLNRRIQGLSGGEAQRTALGRALAYRPSILLLDEPLSALDQTTRQEMIEVLRTVKRATGVTVLHVTHNADEADALADVRLNMDHGQLVG